MLTIAVLHYNRTDLTLPCIKSIDEQEIPVEHEKLLVDNGSEIPIDAPAGWRLFRTEGNYGNIEGQNICFDQAKYPWVLFVSNDVRLRPRCIDFLWKDRDDAQLMPTILNQDLTVQSMGAHIWWPGYGVNDKWNYFPIGFDYIPSICYLMPKQLWKEQNRFDNKYLGAYEDVDFGYRLGGERLICSKNAKAIHLGNATLGYNSNEKFHKARRMLIRKHYSGIDGWSRLTVESLLHIAGKAAKVVTKPWRSGNHRP